MKLMVGELLKPLTEEVDKLKVRLDQTELELKSTTESNEEELMGVIMALKNFADDRRESRKG